MITDVTAEGLLHILRNLRPRDAEEIAAVCWETDTPDDVLARMLPYCGATTWIFTWGGAPAAFIGAVPHRNGVWEMMCFGTDDFPHVFKDLTRFSQRFIIPMLLRARAHRVECRALATYTDTRRWIEGFGAREEAVLKGFGRNGEDFVGYVWRPEDYVRRWRRRHQSTDHDCLPADGSTTAACGPAARRAAA